METLFYTDGYWLQFSKVVKKANDMNIPVFSCYESPKERLLSKTEL